MSLATITPEAARARLDASQACLIDIRSPDEFARRHIAGARSLPLDTLAPAALPVQPGDIIFTCRSGQRTRSHAHRLAALAPGALILEGGIDGWASAGLPLAEDRAAPLELMRQVQIAAGLLVLLGVGLGLTIAPGWHGLALFVGAGLIFAGATGICGMARLLGLLPWNRPA
jgi:rhodanese-related sulfurtransferase